MSASGNNWNKVCDWFTADLVCSRGPQMETCTHATELGVAGLLLLPHRVSAFHRSVPTALSWTINLMECLCTCAKRAFLPDACRN